jgi:hypothetical protein
MSDNLNKAVEEILSNLFGQINSNPSTSNYIFDEDDKAIAEATQALLELINNEKIAEVQKAINRMDTNKTDYADTYHYLIDRIATLKKGSE